MSSQGRATEIDQKDDGLAKELHALREEFNAQQYELSRVNNFVVDLKSRVLAQQKMILSLAEELDAVAMEMPTSVKGVSKESGAIQRH
jgi:predicted  nucleic acid-binding Zn-ribbon protein